jgi:hypothetical protein
VELPQAQRCRRGQGFGVAGLEGLEEVGDQASGCDQRDLLRLSDDAAVGQEQESDVGVVEVVPQLSHVFGALHQPGEAVLGAGTFALFAELTRYAQNGDIRPVVDTVHPLASIATAHRALEAGGVRGKHVIQVA